MPTTEERLAVLENIAQRNGSDINSLFEELRRHAEEEEKSQRALYALIAKIEAKQDKQRSFVGGIVWAVGGIWIAASAAWKYWGA